MSTLKKGDLVMTDMGLAWYDRIENGEHLVNPVAWEKDHLSPHFSATKATRAEVEAYLKGKGWECEQGNYVQLGNMYIIPPPLNGYYGFALEFTAYEPYFDTAPAMQAEAIFMAKLLNATKYN